MDAHLFRIIAPLLANKVTGSRLQGVHAPLPDVTVLTLFGEDGKFRLVWRQHKARPFFYLTEEAPLPNPAFPPDRVMRIRKHGENRRLGKPVIDWLNRRLVFSLPGSDAVAGYLILDMREGAYFTPDPPPSPTEATWPDAKWLREHPGGLTSSGPDSPWLEWPVLTPVLRHTLAALPVPDAAALLVDLEALGSDVFVHSDTKELCAWPPVDQSSAQVVGEPDRILALLKIRYEPDLIALAGQTTRKPEENLEKKDRRREARLKKNLAAERERLDSALALKPLALALQAKLWELDGKETPPSLMLTLDNGSQAELTLDTRLSPSANLQRMFTRIAKAERGLVHLARREASPIPHKQTRQKHGEKPEAARQADIFISSDGFRLIRGKNNRANRQILKEANPSDLWFHVENAPSAHLICKRDSAAQVVPERTLREAGCLVALKSPLQGAAKAPVYCALVKHVRPVKGAADGRVQVETVFRSLMVAVDVALEERLQKA